MPGKGLREEKWKFPAAGCRFGGDGFLFRGAERLIRQGEASCFAHRQLFFPDFPPFAVEVKTLYEAFELANEILCEDIDTMMELVKIGNVELYEQYKAARTIRDIGHGHSSANSQPENDAPPEPVEEVTVTEG